jgi:hypothetical protein
MLPMLFYGDLGAWKNVGGNANSVPVVANGKVFVASDQNLAIFGIGTVSSPLPLLSSSTIIPKIATGARIQTTKPEAVGGPANVMVFGIITSISEEGSMLALRLRDGRMVQVDTSFASQYHAIGVPVVGNAALVRGTFDANGVLQAVQVQRGKNANAYGPDQYPPNLAMPTTTLTSSRNPSMFGQSVTLTATVSNPSATGTVTFADGGTNLGTVVLSHGTATLTISTFSVGSHSLTAVYSGDAMDLTSSSAALIQTVTALPVIILSLQSRPSGSANLSMGVTNTGDTTATNVTVTAITGITATDATFVYNPGLLVIPFVIPGAAVLTPGATSGFNLNFTATSGSPAAPFSFVITVKADNVPPFSTTINVPATLGNPDLQVTHSLARDPSTDEILDTAVVTNAGTGGAANVLLTSVLLGGISPTNPLPNLGNIPPGSSLAALLRFPASAAAHGAATVIRVAGTYTGGSFTASSRVSVP